MKIKITVNTPKNQAAQSVKTQKNAMIGYKDKEKIIEEKVTKHNQFYWILEIEPDDLKRITKKCARGEVIIRKFYRTTFKVIGRANKIAEKSGKAARWMKRFIVKRLRKMTQSGEDDGMMNHIEGMSDEELANFIKITDRDDLEKLLAGDMITLEELDD